MARLLTLLLCLTVLSGCVEKENDRRPQTSPMTSASPTPRATLTYRWSQQPSPVVLRLPEQDVRLRPWTTCWSGPASADGVATSMCADGSPRSLESLPVVKDLDEVHFWFGRPGWTFEAGFKSGLRCDDATPGKVRRTGPQDFTVTRIGSEGRYVVDLFGRGPEGDVVVSFVWDLPAITQLDSDATTPGPTPCDSVAGG